LSSTLKPLPPFLISFHPTEQYIWSSKQIIAASSRRKVCLYHPFNGFTRALDVTDQVVIAFANSGEYLAMAYRKSRRGPKCQDLYVFHIDHNTLFDREHLETEKVRTISNDDVTALCYTRDDDFLMCGTNYGRIFILNCIEQGNKNTHKWIYVRKLSSFYHKDEIVKICFSAKFRYMATMDLYGQVVIWNGGSWTQLFGLQKEHSKFYKHIEWHPFVEEELVFAKSEYPAIYLINVVQKEVVACYMNWNEGMEITSLTFNPVTAQLAVCFYIKGEF
jgi:WD40 repeat protein